MDSRFTPTPVILVGAVLVLITVGVKLGLLSAVAVGVLITALHLAEPVLHMFFHAPPPDDRLSVLGLNDPSR